MSRYLVSGVDVWLNNPRRPMEASGTSGEKASVNGVVNFSVLDGWWAEGYDGTNGWSIGNENDYTNDEEQDKADSNSIYHTLENQIIPAYYNQDRNGLSRDWIRLMKNSIKTTGGKYSMARQVVDYTEKLYIPLCDLNNKYFKDLNQVIEYSEWKKKTKASWESIVLEQRDNPDNAKMVAGSKITVRCYANLANVAEEHANVQVYFGQFLENGSVKNVYTTEMKKVGEEDGKLVYEGTIELPTGGNFGYTFRVMPKHEMLLDAENMNLIKWLTK
jgi:starch phosphorylase